MPELQTLGKNHDIIPTMATYKVLQDIEAEDKLLGPFTLKQFIFAGITIVLGFIIFQIIMSGAPLFIIVPMIVLILPFFLLFGFLAAPIGRDQTSETWLLARLRFLFKPRTRIWSQDGVSELVTITVPKKIETVYTKGFTQDEVKSRLRALANTVDSRGWAVKNVNANMFNQPDYIQVSAATSDRLLDPASIPQEVPSIEVLPSDDMLDPVNNPTAKNLYNLTQQSVSQIRQDAINQMNQAGDQAIENSQQPVDNYYFMHENNVDIDSAPSNYAAFTSQHVVSPGSDQPTAQVEETAEELALAHRAAEHNRQLKDNVFYRGPVLQPLHNKDGSPFTQTSPELEDPKNTQETRQEEPNPDIINHVSIDEWRSKDRSVESLAREVNKPKDSKKSDDNEVVISLH